MATSTITRPSPNAGVDSGVYYSDRQLAGPYEVQTQVDNLYPAHALYLFVPFLVLPAIL